MRAWELLSRERSGGGGVVLVMLLNELFEKKGVFWEFVVFKINGRTYKRTESEDLKEQ